MPRYTRRRKTANKLHRKQLKKKSKATRRKALRSRNRKKRRTKKRGGMPPPSSSTGQPKEPTLEDLLFTNKSFVKLPNIDNKIVNLDNLQLSMAELNQYLKDKKTNKGGKSTGLQINNMNLSDCHIVLRAELTDVKCLNIEYTKTLGDLKIKNYRQIGPLETFNMMVPFITILNLLELRFDATEVPEEEEDWVPMHRLSLLVKDMSEAEFNGESREPQRDLTQVTGKFNEMFNSPK